MPLHFTFGVEASGGRIDGAVAPEIGAHAVTLNGLVLDTRFLPGGWAGPRPQALVNHVIDGEISIDGRTFGAGSTFAFPSQRIARDTAQSARIRTRGKRVRIVSARVPAEDAPWLEAEPFALAAKDDRAWHRLVSLLTGDERRYR